MSKAERIYELEVKIQRTIKYYGEPLVFDVIELADLYESLNSDEEDELLSLYKNETTKNWGI